MLGLGSHFLHEDLVNIALTFRKLYQFYKIGIFNWLT